MVGIEGLVNVLKPPGMTSQQVVSYLRRSFGARAGHGGTLDPGAAGVLVVLLGKATRLSEFLLMGSKSYRVEMVLGATTVSQDTASPPMARSDASFLDAHSVREAIRELSGEIWQVPPMRSALKMYGQPLYRLARAGREVQRPPRLVTIHEACLVEFWPGPRARAMVDLSCSHGTYVRTWCADLGDKLGVGGYMSFLVRTRVGPFGLEEAITLEELQERHGQREGILQPMVRAVEFLPAVELAGSRDHARLMGGQMLREYRSKGNIELAPGTRVRVMGPEGSLLAIAELRKDGLRPLKVLAEQEDGSCKCPS